MVAGTASFEGRSGFEWLSVGKVTRIFQDCGQTIDSPPKTSVPYPDRLHPPLGTPSEKTLLLGKNLRAIQNFHGIVPRIPKEGPILFMCFGSDQKELKKKATSKFLALHPSPRRSNPT